MYLSNHKRKAKTFIVTHEVYDALFSKQSGRCALCDHVHEEGNIHRLIVDWNFPKYKPRGLLCVNCKQSLDQFINDPGSFEQNEGAQAAIEYLNGE